MKSTFGYLIWWWLFQTLKQTHSHYLSVSFQEAQSGIVVPGYQGPSGVVHEECLARAILKVSEDPQREGLLRYLIDYEETHTPSDWAKDVSGDSVDVSWEWTDVGIPATKIRSLLNAGLVSIVFSTNSSTYYSLVGRNVIKEALGKAQEISKSTTEQLGLPDDLFECIIGYDDLKGEIKFTLRESRRRCSLIWGHMLKYVAMTFMGLSCPGMR